MTPDQLRTRQRIEGMIRLMSPALDAVLAVGERVSRIVEREDVEYYPPRVTHESPPPPKQPVNREEQLQWEARWAVPAAIAAFAAGLMLLVSGLLFIPEDREGIEPNPGHTALDPRAVGCVPRLRCAGSRRLADPDRGLPVPLPRLHLPRGRHAALVHLPGRGRAIFYAIASVLGALDAIDIADEFAGGSPIRGQAGEDRAGDLGGSSGLLVGLSTAGTVGMAFLFVMLPLRARRVGLLTPFMGILGVVAGALIVFRGQLPGLATVLQAFWLGALGALLLGRWPGGRGPAWASGTAEPWPTAAQRRGVVPMPGEEEGAGARPHAARAGARAGAAEVAQAAPQELVRRRSGQAPAVHEDDHHKPCGGGCKADERVAGCLRKEAAGEWSEQVADDPDLGPDDHRGNDAFNRHRLDEHS